MPGGCDFGATEDDRRARGCCRFLPRSDWTRRNGSVAAGQRRRPGRFQVLILLHQRLDQSVELANLLLHVGVAGQELLHPPIAQGQLILNVSIGLDGHGRCRPRGEFLLGRLRSDAVVQRLVVVVAGPVGRMLEHFAALVPEKDTASAQVAPFSLAQHVNEESGELSGVEPAQFLARLVPHGRQLAMDGQKRHSGAGSSGRPTLKGQPI